MQIRRAAVVVLAFGLGVGGTAAVAARDGGAAPAATTTTTTAPTTVTDAAPRTVEATTPEEAVRGFLDAEQAGDYERSYDFLSDADRAAFGTAAGWVAAHADLVPPIEGYDLVADTTAVVRYTPSLDTIVGLVPARATVTWAVSDGEAFGISLEGTTSQPELPSADGATTAVQAWVDGCADPAREWDGDLLGSPSLAEGLCEGTAGAPTTLGPAEGAPFSAAFGVEVSAWARVVPVDGPVPLRAVVAPLGDDWVVVGVLATGPGAGL